MENKKKKIFIVSIVVAFFIVASIFFELGKKVPQSNNEEGSNGGIFENLNSVDLGGVFGSIVGDKSEEQKISHIVHRDITVTVFWVGEGATSENNYITNVVSAWDSFWVDSFGGVDDPFNREGFYPTGFVPKENPFYFALPYNDLREDGKRKKDASKVIPWAEEREWAASESMVKNKWIKIEHEGKVAFAQWEDVGPFESNDKEYVFGEAGPKSEINKNAGLDVSPAVRDYLGLEGIDVVDWQFVDDEDVPDGPWKEIVTTSKIRR